MEKYFILIACIIATEAITELLVKGVIFNPIRNYFINKSRFFEYLLTCGYCFSFWTSFMILIILLLFKKVPNFIDGYLNIFLIFFILQRGSNILHGFIDRYADTRKDIRYRE